MDGVPCGIGTYVPSQLIVHTVLFVCFANFLSLFEFHFVYMVFRVVLVLLHPVSWPCIRFYLCCVCFALILCASNDSCGIGVP